jgi:hypothetical protein
MVTHCRRIRRARFGDPDFQKPMAISDLISALSGEALNNPAIDIGRSVVDRGHGRLFSV